MADQGQKTEKPTPRRLQKARREGNYVVSRELTSAVQFTAFVALLCWFGPAWMEKWRAAMRSLLTVSARTDLTVASTVRLCRDTARAALLPLAEAGGLLLLIPIAAQLGMTQFGVAGKRLAPDLSRLNGFKRLAGLPKQAVPTLAQSLLLFALVVFAIRSIIGADAAELMRLASASPDSSFSKLGATVASLLWKGAGVFLLLGFIDLFRQRRKYDKQMRMSKQEIREEFKESEGNPQIKQKIRRLQRDLARRRMVQQVPTATAVIVNPTHYSVAIKYSLEFTGAPTVVAKGKNYLARRIREIAIEHGVPIVENQPLAQALYKSAEVGQEIPAHLYRAVAEILAYIYRLMNGRLPT